MKVLMNDFRAEPEALKQAVLASVARVIESGWYVLGKEVEAFEAEWARACGTLHAVGVGNGMDAIEIGLRAAGIGPGDEVITTGMTAYATVLGVMRSGATPVLADIDPSTAIMDLESVERCISRRTRAVLLVHLYGRLDNMDKWESLCGRTGIQLIEDCAQAHLAQWNSQYAGSFGKFGAYSFYPTKNLGAIGDAGAIVTSDQDLAARASRLRNYGQAQRYHHPELGLNSRLDEIQAAILRAKVAWLEEFTCRRRDIADSYWKGINNTRVRLLARTSRAEQHVHHLFVVRCSERDKLVAHLAKNNVQTLVHYPVPAHRQPQTQHLARDPDGLRQTEAHADSCLSLPCHPQMSNEQVATVIESVNSFE